MKVLILGLGVSGRAAAKLLLKRKWHVTAADRNRELLNSNEEIAHLKKEGMSVVWESSPVDIRQFDLVVVSPGVPKTNPLYQKAIQNNIEVIGEIELACRYLNNPCIGITGTNGKTTTTLLTEHVLNESGKHAKALGNIGIPLSAAIDEEPEGTLFVLELSSWQLDTLHAKVLDAAAILNITPNHLDRYDGMDAYANAKLRITKCLKPDGLLIIEKNAWDKYGRLAEDCSPLTYGYSKNADVRCNKEGVYFQDKLEFPLPEEYRGAISHEVENFMASYMLCKKFSITPEQFLKALPTFKKPPHRIEFVVSKRGVAYYNDSKGTSLDAVKRAVQSLDGGIILIVGGVHKGASYKPWEEAFLNKVRFVCAIGESAPLIQNDISHAVPVSVFPTLQEAVKFASKIAVKGENILLSPGCSSFDMFRDYEHRGNEFKRIVQEL